MNQLRVALVGYGYMGRIRRAAIQRNEDLRLVAICDPRIAGSEADGLAIARDHHDVLGPDVDAVFVCTPNNVTADIVVQALEAGLHVFAEKPPGRCVADIERMRGAERESPDLRLMFGFNHRHHTSIRDAKALIDAGSLGRLLWLRGVYGKSGGEGFERSWRNDPAISGGGILLDQGIHMLDLFRFFCGEFDEVAAMRSMSFWPIEVEDNAFVLLRNASGQIAQLHSSATLWKNTFQLEIGLEEGYLLIGGLLTTSRSYGRESLVIGRRSSAGSASREEVIYYDSDPSMDTEVTRFIGCIRAGTPVIEGGSRDALQTMMLIDRIYRCAPPRKMSWATAR